MTKITFILLLFTLLSCNSSKKENQEVKQDSLQDIASKVGNSPQHLESHEQAEQTIYKISRNKDSIVLLGSAPFYDRVQIFRSQKMILDYTEKELQILCNYSDGSNLNWYTEHYDKGYLYIIRVFNAPGPDKFLIIKTTDTKTSVIGMTEPSSAEIFGDVDYDGKFEIGGMSGWCQGGDTTCHPADHYRVFEITDNFPTDITLTNYFKQFLKKK